MDTTIRSPKLIREKTRQPKQSRSTDHNTDENFRAFREEALPHRSLLYTSALKLTGDREDANDLLQETYMKAFRFFHLYKRGTNCKAWLYQIMRNSFINVYRKVSKEPEKVRYEAIEEFYESIKDDSVRSNDLEEHLYSNLLGDEVAQALEKLPEDFLTVIILRDIEGFTYEEIAEFVRCPIGTVRSRLFRSRKMLANLLGDFAQQRGYSVAAS